VVLGFADAEVYALLGLEEQREFPLCLVPIGASDSEISPAAESPEEVSFRVLPFSQTEHVYQGILRANDAGRLDAPKDARTWRRTVFAREQVESTPPFSSDTAPDALEDVLRRRGSARIFAPGAIPAAVLRTILERATVGIPTDYAPGGARLVEPYLIANAVQGLDPGAYVFRDGELRLLERGDFRGEAGFLCLEQELGTTAAATHFLMADLPRILDALGARVKVTMGARKGKLQVEFGTVDDLERIVATIGDS
jgi:nitroreductase